jgi:hypothetical protein
MKKTLICFNNWRDFYPWQEANGGPRIYRNNGLQRLKIDKELFIVLYISWSLAHWTISRLEKESIVEVLWLGNTRLDLPQDTVEEIMSILPFKFDATKSFPERDMGLGGLAQFHSVPVYVRLRDRETISERKAWYMFATKAWVYAGTTETIDVAEWYASWYIP